MDGLTQIGPLHTAMPLVESSRTPPGMLAALARDKACDCELATSRHSVSQPPSKGQRKAHPEFGYFKLLYVFRYCNKILNMLMYDGHDEGMVL